MSFLSLQICLTVIDFFGEEVDSIRSFSTEDQLSVSILNQVTIIPNIQDISVEQ